MKEPLENLKTILVKVDEIVRQYDDKPVAGSQAERECSNYQDPVRIAEAYNFGRLSLRAGREHLSVLSGLYEKNIFTSAVISRAILEASSLAFWFLDPSIDETERVRRGLIQLCDGKEHVVKKTGTANSVRVDDFFDNRLPRILAKLAIEFRNSKGKIVNPQKLKPKISDLVEKFYGEKSEYAVLSGIVHGQAVALLTFGYDIEKAIAGKTNEVEYKPNQISALFVLGIAVKSYIKAIYTQFTIFGWDFTKIEPYFDGFYQSFSETHKSIK